MGNLRNKNKSILVSRNVIIYHHSLKTQDTVFFNFSLHVITKLISKKKSFNKILIFIIQIINTNMSR